MHDLVIDNAVVVDGLGTPARAGGVVVTDGRIAAIGRDLGAARERVDAQGLALAPGISGIPTRSRRSSRGTPPSRRQRVAARSPA